MNFLSILLRGFSLVPGVIQGVESLFGAKSGDQKKQAALAIVSSALNVADSVTNKQIADPNKFTSGLSLVIDGVVSCLNASIWTKK